MLYAVGHDKDVRGVRLTGTTEDARRALIENGPVSVAPIDDAELVEYARITDEFTIHDGIVVASHRARDTDAILTTDGAVRDAGYRVLWD